VDSSTISGLVFLVFGAAVFIYGASLYFSLVRLRQANDHAWFSLNTQLKEYAQEVAKLINIRTEGGLADKTLALLAQSLADFMQADSAEKKSEAYMRLSGALSGAKEEDSLNHGNRIKELEGSISALAKNFNAGAANYNRRIGQIPDVVVASIAGLERMELFSGSRSEPQ
jgi:hypothetical protein